ncbi:MAG: nitrile hydratase accessory protein [Rhodospirillales bacterium]|nr:nitrile hydratase accessory protein [Rhodospirillales bacterium]
MNETTIQPPQAILDMLPDDGSGPVFKEPWQARIFALVSQMYMDGQYIWDDFKHLLIDEIQTNGADDGSDYYERWLAAAERLVTAKGMAQTAALAERKAHLADHPPHPTTSDSGPIAVDPARKS